MGLNVRQIKRLVRRYREVGTRCLVSGHRGKVPGNTKSSLVRQAVLSLVREYHKEFGPTIAAKKLSERRAWMIAGGLWQSKRRCQALIDQRRPGLAELVQIDRCPHAWLEDQVEPCTLIVFIDVATSRLLALRFVPAEATRDYSLRVEFWDL